jgi:hypothetical protein
VARRVRLLAVLAAIIGLAIQVPLRPAAPTSALSNCSTDPSGLAGIGLSPTATVTCVGWSGPNFEAGSAPADVLVRDARPRPGESCRDLHFYRVTFDQVDGAVRGTFFIFGGASRGTMTVSTNQIRLVDTSVAYVTDVQLGSYETSWMNGSARLWCDINSTYHLYCPSKKAIDQLCYTWLARSYERPKSPPTLSSNWSAKLSSRRPQSALRVVGTHLPEHWQHTAHSGSKRRPSRQRLANGSAAVSCDVRDAYGTIAARASASSLPGSLPRIGTTSSSTMRYRPALT